MLSIGAAMLGAQHVVGIDVDDDALRVAQQNVEEFADPLPVSWHSKM
jgi:predicted RNA methylase